MVIPPHMTGIALHCPFDRLVAIAARLWPDLCCEVRFGDPGKRKLGTTTFYNDGSPPTVVVRATLPLEQAVGVLAHELAHVAVPDDARHGRRWKAAHQRLFDAWETE